MSCSDSNCVIVGRDYATSDALIINSEDGGQNWACSIPSSEVVQGSFRGVDCSGLICVAGGDYDSQAPLIANSVDGGQTWTYSQGIPGSVTNSRFDSVSVG